MTALRASASWAQTLEVGRLLSQCSAAPQYWGLWLITIHGVVEA